jgi:penicillin V acylase-like amidase (Ntn superfamily)
MKYIVLILLVVMFQARIFPCTIFSISDNENILVGNNEDNFYNGDYFLKIFPPNTDTYGRVEFYNMVKRSFFFNLFKLPINNIQGGMNEKGLFFDIAGTPQDNIQIKNNPFQNALFQKNTLDMFLAKCKNIDESIIYLKNIKWGSVIPSFHMLIADNTGKSAVIEWTAGKMNVIEKKGVFQIITNYLITKPWFPDGGGWEREDIFFKHFDASAINIKNTISLLKSTSQKSETIGTVYSNIYDIKKLTMTLFINANDSIMRTFNLIEEFKKGEKIYSINYRLLSMK